MAISAEQLNVILSARDREFTRAMDRAQRRVERFSQQSKRSLMSASGSFTALAGAARTFLPALSAALVVRQVRRVVSELDEIGKKADAIGLTTDALQELRTVAEEAGVAQEALDNSMMQFSRRLGEARQGLGQARYALDDLNLSAEELSQMPLDKALETVAEEMTKVEDATARTALAQQLFGRSGVPMLNLLREGADGMAAMRQNARDLGIVIDEDLIRKAEDAENKLGLMSRVINANLSEALINLAPILTATAQGIANISKAINMIFDAFAGEDDVGTRIASLIQQQAALQMQMETIRNTAVGGADLRANPALGNSDAMSGVERQLRAVNRELNTMIAAQQEAQAIANGADGFLIDPLIFEDTEDDVTTLTGGVRDLTDAFTKMMQDALEANPILEDLGFTAETLGDTMRLVESEMENAFMSIVDGTMTTKEAFRAMAADIIKQLYRVLVVQRMVGTVESGTGIAGAIGRVFGIGATGAASGRPVQAGQPYTVGEHGRELFVPQSAGRVLSVSQAQNAVGGGGSVVVNQTINVSTGVQQTVRTEIKQLMPQIAESAKNAVVDAKRRGGSYGRAFS